MARTVSLIQFVAALALCDDETGVRVDEPRVVDLEVLSRETAVPIELLEQALGWIEQGDYGDMFLQDSAEGTSAGLCRNPQGCKLQVNFAGIDRRLFPGLMDEQVYNLNDPGTRRHLGGIVFGACRRNPAAREALKAVIPPETDAAKAPPVGEPVKQAEAPEAPLPTRGGREPYVRVNNEDRCAFVGGLEIEILRRACENANGVTRDELLAVISGVDPRDLDAALQELVRHEIIFEMFDHDDDGYVLGHIVVIQRMQLGEADLVWAPDWPVGERRNLVTGEEVSLTFAGTRGFEAAPAARPGVRSKRRKKGADERMRKTSGAGRITVTPYVVHLMAAIASVGKAFSFERHHGRWIQSER